MNTQTEAQGQSPGANIHTHGTRQSYMIGLGYAVVLTLASFCCFARSARFRIARCSSNWLAWFARDCWRSCHLDGSVNQNGIGSFARWFPSFPGGNAGGFA